MPPVDCIFIPFQSATVLTALGQVLKVSGHPVGDGQDLNISPFLLQVWELGKALLRALVLTSASGLHTGRPDNLAYRETSGDIGGRTFRKVADA